MIRLEAITTALLDLYHEGQRDERQLARYAVSRALVVSREKSLILRWWKDYFFVVFRYDSTALALVPTSFTAATRAAFDTPNLSVQ